MSGEHTARVKRDKQKKAKVNENMVLLPGRLIAGIWRLERTGHWPGVSLVRRQYQQIVTWSQGDGGRVQDSHGLVLVCHRESVNRSRLGLRLTEGVCE